MDQAAQVRPGFFAQAIRRRWRFVVLGALLGALAGYAASSQLPISYTSSSTLSLQPLAGNPYAPDLGSTRTDQLAALETEAELTANPAVVALAAARSTVSLPESPQDSLAAVPESNTQVLTLTYTAESSAVAAAGAQAFADAYLEYRATQAAAADAATQLRLQAQVTSTAAVVDATMAALAAAVPDSAAELSLQSQLAVYADSLAQLRLALAEISGPPASPGTVISAASDPTPSGLPIWQLIAGGLAAGTLIGTLGALAREHSDDRVRTPGELTAVGVGHPLAAVQLGSSGVDLDEPAPPGYGLLLTGALARAGTDGSTVCILGLDRDVVDEVAAGLAATAYRSRRTTLALGVQPVRSWGAAEVLPVTEIALPGEAGATLRRPAGRLMVLPLDLQEAASEELVLSPALPRFVERARAAGALVILSGGSSRAASGQTLARAADLALVVVELGRDTFTDVVDEVQTLHEAGVTRVALVTADRRRRRGAVPRRSGTEPTSRAPAPGAVAGRPSDAPITEALAVDGPTAGRPGTTPESARR